MRRSVILGILGIGALFSSCSTSSKETEIAEANVNVVKADISQIAHDNNAFAFELYRALKDNHSNMLFSPYSISSALSIAYLGAGGETANQMSRTLHYNLDAAQIAKAFGILNTQLTSNNDEALNHPQLDIANSLWIQRGQNILPAFTALAIQDHGAVVREVNFKEGLDSSRIAINLWVEQKTRDKIHDLLKPDDITKDTRLVIVSAIYMKGKWKHGFSEKETQNGPFTAADGQNIYVPFMKTKGAYPLFIHDQFALVQMPYKGGVDSPDLAMVFIVPKGDAALADIENQLNPETLRNWLNQSQEQRIQLEIPKFKLTEALNLEDVLQNLGMKEAFLPSADFSGITGSKDLMISKVVHQAFASVDEQGTEAAAATGVSMNVTAIFEPEKLFVFRADRPFIFAMVDRRTQAILFLGRLAQPVASDNN